MQSTECFDHSLPLISYTTKKNTRKYSNIKVLDNDMFCLASKFAWNFYNGEFFIYTEELLWHLSDDN